MLPPGPAQAAGQPDLNDDCYGPTKPLTAEWRGAFVAEQFDQGIGNMLRKVLITVLCCASSAATAEEANEFRVRAAVEAYFKPLIGSPGQYMRNGCDERPVSYGDWKEVYRCNYTTAQPGLTVRTKATVKTTAYFVFPDEKKIASWIVSSCKQANRDLWDCSGKLAQKTWLASNAQFPVSGYVAEPPQSKFWKHPDRPYCYLFRDGVTIATESWETQAEIEGRCGDITFLRQPVLHALNFARIASTSRGGYKIAHGSEPVGSDAAASPEWSTAAGKAFRHALDSDQNVLMLGAVFDGFDRCAINVLDKNARPPAHC
jgi:hypothetical protein